MSSAAERQFDFPGEAHPSFVNIKFRDTKVVEPTARALMLAHFEGCGN